MLAGSLPYRTSSRTFVSGVTRSWQIDKEKSATPTIFYCIKLLLTATREVDRINIYRIAFDNLRLENGAP